MSKTIAVILILLCLVGSPILAGVVTHLLHVHDPGLAIIIGLLIGGPAGIPAGLMFFRVMDGEYD